MAENPVPVCAAADIPPGSVKSFEVGDELVAVYNIDGTFYATEARCTHAFADLADGILEGDVIECSLHFGAFNVPNRQGRAGALLRRSQDLPDRGEGRPGVRRSVDAGSGPQPERQDCG